MDFGSRVGVRNDDSTVVLEERIEEVTTTSYSDLDNVDAEDVENIDGVNVLESGEQMLSKMRVPFPELGLDLIDPTVYCFEEEAFMDDKTVRISDLLSWEENWLFQKKKKSACDIVAQYCFSALETANCSNRMLIPNPSQLMVAKIGSKALDELSDLSERNSVGSLDFSDEELETSSVGALTGEPIELGEILTADDSNLFEQPDAEKPEVLTETLIEVLPRVKRSPENEAICVEVVPKCVPIPQFVPSQQRLSEPIEDPCFVFPPGSASVQSGILIQFCCRVKGSHPIGVSWFKGDLRLINDDDYRIIESVNDHILEIKCTRQHLAGNYSCVVFNHLNQKWSDFTLEVKTCRNTKSEMTPPERTLNKGEKEVLPKGSSPTVIQRTWDQRRAEENNDKRQAAMSTESDISPPPPLPDDTVGSVIPPTTSIAEREHKKWEECAIEWPNNPYTQENIERRKLLRAASLESVLDDCSLTDDCDQMPNITPSKDLSRYQRDYFVPNVVGKEEALNCFEEKVYSSSKYFSLRNKPKFGSEECLRTDHHPEMCTGPEETMMPSISVKDLVNKFSENNDHPNPNPHKIRRRSTFSYTNRPKLKENGVNVNLTRINTNYKVHSLTARNLTKYRDESRKANGSNCKPTISRSKSLVNIDKCSNSSNSSETCSPTNEGYNSDESNSSGFARKTPQVTTVKLKTPKKISRSILKRASYWEKRCEQGLLSDSSVNDDFPPMDESALLK